MYLAAHLSLCTHLNHLYVPVSDHSGVAKGISTTNILTLLVTGCLDKSVTCQSQEILRSTASEKNHTVQWCECCWNVVDEKDVNALEMLAIRSCHSITCKSKY